MESILQYAEIISTPLGEVCIVLDAVLISKTDEALAQKQIKYSIDKYQKLKQHALQEIDVTQRRIRQMPAEFRKIG